MRLTDLLALSHVPRWTIVPTIKSQSVADHTFRVAAIMKELGDRMNIAITFNDLWAVIYHDGAESRSGDIPGVFKKGIAEAIQHHELEVCPWLEVQDQADHPALLKLADLIETATFIRRYGLGDHPDRVYDFVYREIQRHCVSAEFDYGIVEQMMRDINADADREPRWGRRREDDGQTGSV